MPNPRPVQPRSTGRPCKRLVAAVAATLVGASAGIATANAAPPEIRLSGVNRVPQCVTPDRLMSFLKARNRNLDRRFANIANWYRKHGEAWRVRWDYAFFQMAIETNFLSYRRPDGRWGDVDPRQNNFAGIGTTGGGVPGDTFPDVGTGVLAQIQHLVAYSGEPLAAPVAPRTRLKQADIVAASRNLGRPVRFSDLARRWAVDPRYGHSIEYVANLFRREHCAGTRGVDAKRPNDANGASGPGPQEPLPWRRSSSLDDGGNDGIVAPAPSAVQRPRQIVRTIWKRGDPPVAVASSIYRAVGSVAKADVVAAPSAVISDAPRQAALAAGAHVEGAAASSDGEADTSARAASKTAIDRSQMSGLLGSLSVMARSFEMPIVAPSPRLALRSPR